MKLFPFLLGLSVLFWGWQTGLWLFAIPLGIILEVVRFYPVRWELSDDDFRRIGSLCITLLVGCFSYLLIAQKSVFFIYLFFQWLPLIISPLVVSQLYSTREKINIRLFFLFLSKSDPNKRTSWLEINLKYPYFVLCILSASNANTSESVGFYIGMFILSLIALFSVKSNRYSWSSWVIIMLLAGSLGFMGQVGLHNLHIAVENKIVEWLGSENGERINTTRKSTSFGDVGNLKLSNKIVLRLTVPPNNLPPQLLREASYNKYKDSMWFATKSQFKSIPSEDKKTWVFSPDFQGNIHQVRIYAHLYQEKGLLRLPDGTFEVNNLLVNQVERNQYGTVQVTGKEGSIDYQLNYHENLSLDSPPTTDDLSIPTAEKPALQQVIRSLNLTHQPPDVTVKKINRFFQDNFTYSLYQSSLNQKITPLSAFLLKTRRGHCEYFATATTLLLRELGIPTRYAVGYAVHEYSNLEQQYIVRSRHAHAWTLVYLKGKWVSLDTTPQSWFSLESAKINPLSKISDFSSWLIFASTQWLRSHPRTVYWVLLGFLGMSALRQLGFQRGSRRLIVSPGKKESKIVQGGEDSSSEFRLIEEQFQKLGYSRYPSESLKQWIARLHEDLPSPEILEGLEAILTLHYRDRFDPQGLTLEEKEALKLAVQRWLSYQIPRN